MEFANRNCVPGSLSPGSIQLRRGAPRLSWMDPGLREPGTQFLLANSITLTPGTVTVALHGGRLCVYALDQEFAAGIKDSEFVRRLRRWEGKQDG